MVGRGRRGGARAQCSYRFQEPFAITEEDPELLQVGVREVGEDFEVNRMVVERLFVALQPKILQPSRDIHDVLLPK